MLRYVRLTEDLMHAYRALSRAQHAAAPALPITPAHCPLPAASPGGCSPTRLGRPPIRGPCLPPWTCGVLPLVGAFTLLP